MYIEIEVVWRQKEYDGKTSVHDISLIELKTPFKWSSTVKPACLPNVDVHEYKGPLMVSSRLLRSRFSLTMSKCQIAKWIKPFLILYYRICS